MINMFLIYNMLEEKKYIYLTKLKAGKLFAKMYSKCAFQENQSNYVLLNLLLVTMQG